MTLLQAEPGLSRAERVALCALRRAVGGQAGAASLVCPFGLGRDQAQIHRALLAVWQGRQAECARALPLRPPGGFAVTKLERRLLRAVAAAQNEAFWLLDNYLYRIALEPAQRARLVAALDALAAALAVHGYWLEAPRETPPLAASAMRVASQRGLDLATAQVAWP